MVLIDYPGFNLRLAASLRKQGYKGKLIHYVCPTVWAWGKHRIPQMEKTLDSLLTIFPFEAKSFDGSKLDVKYVGHPLLEILNEHIYHEDFRKEMQIPETAEILGVFPGSRQGEVMRNFPRQLEAAKVLKEQVPDMFIGVSVASEELRKPIERIIHEQGLILGKDVAMIPQHMRYDLMKSCRAAIATSGTITLELGLHGVPSVIVYVLASLNYFLARYVFRLILKHYCIVNIICDKTVFPELIHHNFSADGAAFHLRQLWADDAARKECLEGCRELQEQLHQLDGSKQAANAVLELLDA